jgi:mannose-6-phosphate isomerase-like protein (cupin superfamily)
MSEAIRKGAADVRRELFGGRGEVQVWSLLETAAEPFTAILSCELSAGGSVGQHVQQQFPEVVVGLSGRGQASVDGRVRPLGAGDVVHVPLGSVLALENPGQEPLRYLIIKARG